MQRIGTTKRGIGPAYEDKVGRRALRVIDLQGSRSPARPRSSACSRITMRCAGASASEKSMPRALLHDADRDRAQDPALRRARPGASSTRRGARASAFCSKARRRVLLDIDHGTYPYRHVVQHRGRAGGGGLRHCGRATSATCWASPRAYTTRVGEGPFPTELNDAIGEQLGDARRGVRHRDRAQAPLRLVRCGAGAPDRASPAASTASR